MLGTYAITFCMLVVANICSALMVQAENRNRPHLAGLFEAGWAVLYLVAAKYSLDAIGGGVIRTVTTLSVLISGNYLGGYLGTKWGEKLVHDQDEIIVNDRLSEAEAALIMTERTLHELHQEIEHHHEHNPNSH